MAPKRREFIQMSSKGMLLLPFMPQLFHELSHPAGESVPTTFSNPIPTMQEEPNLIGPYGPWAATHQDHVLPGFSFRSDKWKDLQTWKKQAHAQAVSRLGIPVMGDTPAVTVEKSYVYEGLHIEELSWQLPYGRPTKALLLRPDGVQGRLPGILAFHDHGGNKYFGIRKITRTPGGQHSDMTAHQQEYYESRAWANELAKRGYVVLVPDAFTFASRRVWMQDVPEHLRHGLTDENPEDSANIAAYNHWAGEHEHIMAKSLFSAGMTWPGVFFAEDRVALDILAARPDVDAGRLGCGGLSGGGLRTDFMAGLDDRIKCSVTVGFMTTWRDFILNKSYTHTWMTYVPQLPTELDFPEILGLRAPQATLVLSCEEDPLYTLPEMKRSDEQLKAVFAKAGAPDHYRTSFYPGGHQFNAAMQEEAFDWWDRWLK
ncbi:MAG: hypothetical protein KDC28_14360 [Saprospiraceae bacterium]|nr:hypothetical protein [Saprospiraceae bacterium]MCB9317947.1 hypothetical protein [Lewinellaceae bacterium]